MTSKQQIDKAIGAHGIWKTRLRTAIDSGQSEFKVEVVKTDNNCDFGKWLHGDLPAELKASPTYKTILKYHAEFHAEAARVLQLALAARKAEAEQAMNSASPFAKISASLTSSMIEWKKSLR